MERLPPSPSRQSSNNNVITLRTQRSDSRPRLRTRSSSCRSEEERQEITQHVEAEHLRRSSSVKSNSRLLQRKRSAYLPVTLKNPESEDQLRLAKRAINTIYEIHQRYEQRRLIENTAFAFAMIGIILVLVDNEYAESATAKLVLRIINSVATLILLWLIVWRFQIERDILIKRNIIAQHESIFRTPTLLFKLVWELVVCSFIIPPGLDESFDVWEWKFYLLKDSPHCPAPFSRIDESCYLRYPYRFEVLGLLSLFRLYMVPRIIRNLSDFSNYRTSYLGVLYHVDTVSSLFAVKCFLRSHPFKFMTIGFVCQLVLTSYALTILEAPVNASLASIWNCMWLVVLTMSTIGYGDLFPITFAGQLLLVFGGMLAGILLFSIFSAAIFAFLGLQEPDRHFIHLLRRQEHDQKLKHACAWSIQAAWKRYFAQRQNHYAAKPHKYHQCTFLWHRYGHKCINMGKVVWQKVYKRTSEQRILRRQAVGEYKSMATEAQSCRDELIGQLRQEHHKTMQRLRSAEARIDAMRLKLADAA